MTQSSDRRDHERHAHYWDSVMAGEADRRPQRTWRSYCDDLHTKLLARWLPNDRVQRLLKTDLFDESRGEGLSAVLQARSHHVFGVDLSARSAHVATVCRHRLLACCADVRCKEG